MTKLWNPVWIVEEYRALKAHFLTDYDYFKYGGKTKAANIPVKYLKQAKRIQKHEDPFKLILSNLRLDPQLWLGDIVDHRGFTTYLAFKKQTSSMAYLFKQELSHIEGMTLREAVEVKNGHPLIIRLYAGQKWSLETFTIFCYCVGCLDYLDKALAKDTLWESLGRQTRKYKSFLEYDQEKYISYIMEIRSR